MTMQNHNVPVAETNPHPHAENARRIHYLSGSKPLRIERKEQTVEVLFGSAWVTMDGEDFILHTGDQLQINPGGDFALVSSLQQKRLVLAVSA